MAATRRPVAEVFQPGEFIREEIEARGWTQRDLAEVLGRPLQSVNAIINGKKAVTPQTAAELAAAFGTSAEYWINLETAYQLSHVAPVDPSIVERSRQRSRTATPGREKRGHPEFLRKSGQGG